MPISGNDQEVQIVSAVTRPEFARRRARCTPPSAVGTNKMRGDGYRFRTRTRAYPVLERTPPPGRPVDEADNSPRSDHVFSGPIVKNKVFFYGKNRIRAGTPRLCDPIRGG